MDLVWARTVSEGIDENFVNAAAPIHCEIPLILGESLPPNRRSFRDHSQSRRWSQPGAHIQGARNWSAVLNFLHHGIFVQDRFVFRDGRIQVPIETHTGLTERAANPGHIE